MIEILGKKDKNILKFCSYAIIINVKVKNEKLLKFKQANDFITTT